MVVVVVVVLGYLQITAIAYCEANCVTCRGLGLKCASIPTSPQFQLRDHGSGCLICHQRKAIIGL